jgi:glycerol-3-phosphate O-acyltransferase
VPYSDRIGLTELDGKALIEYGARMKILQRVPHPLGNVVVTQPEQAMMLTYFRNNILHMYIIPSLVACLVQQNGQIQREQLVRVISLAVSLPAIRTVPRL